jgi:hypothetical protein
MSDELSFVVAPYGRAGYAVAAVPGDGRIVEGAFAGEVLERVRRVVTAPCSESELIERYCCLSCACLLHNRFQLESHVSPGVHYIAQWCIRCHRWEPARAGKVGQGDS